METERKQRSRERLVTVDDYEYEINRLVDMSVSMDMEKNPIDATIFMLCKNLKKKYKYIIGISAKFRHKQDILSYIADLRRERKAEKQEKKERLEQEERERMAEQARLAQEKEEQEKREQEEKERAKREQTKSIAQAEPVAMLEQGDETATQNSSSSADIGEDDVLKF